MSHVSRGFLSAQVVQQRFQLRHDEGEVWSTSAVLCHPRQQSKLRSLGSPAMVVERPVRFKVVSEECCVEVDATRPPRIELSPGSMSQFDLGEELSWSSKI